MDIRANVCRISENEDFLKSLTDLTKKAKCKLTVCPEEENLDDQWMQVRGPVHRWAPGAQPRTWELSFLGWTRRKGASEGTHTGGSS